MAIGEDIYEYHFSRLFEHIKSIIGRNTIQVYDTKKKNKKPKNSTKHWDTPDFYLMSVVMILKGIKNVNLITNIGLKFIL